jgi:DMSO/TMAO reductase YedYZ molybdopterin-dependent catalytic subunit
MPNAGRTINGIPRMAQKHAADPHLRVFGAVALEQSIDPEALAALPHSSMTGAMTCNETGRRPDAEWSGVLLSDLMIAAGAAPATRFINISAGPYSFSVDISRAGETMLADRLDGEPIDVTQGGPWRLVILEERLCNSVKWVDAVEFSLDTPNNSAARIAQARTRAREKRASTS